MGNYNFNINITKILSFDFWHRCSLNTYCGRGLVLWDHSPSILFCWSQTYIFYLASEGLVLWDHSPSTLSSRWTTWQVGASPLGSQSFGLRLLSQLLFFFLKRGGSMVAGGSFVLSPYFLVSIWATRNFKDFLLVAGSEETGSTPVWIKRGGMSQEATLYFGEVHRKEEQSRRDYGSLVTTWQELTSDPGRQYSGSVV